MEKDPLSSDAFWQSTQCEVMANPRDQGALADAEKIRSLAAGVDELSGHVLFATSGSTGKSKWCALSRRALLASARMVNDHLDAGEGDRWLLALPVYHVGGIGILARAYLSSSPVVQLAGKWCPCRYGELLREQESTLSSLVPTQLVDLVQSQQAAPPSLRAVLIGGGRLADDVHAKAVELGWPVLETYGMTETCSQVATSCVGSRELRLLSGWQARLNGEGRLLLKGEAMMSAYVTRVHDRLDISSPLVDGWLLSDDVVEMESGVIVVKGRSDRCVKVLGELVNLAAIEQSLAEHASALGYSVAEWPVVAIPDERKGSRIILCLEQDIDAGKLIDAYNADCMPVRKVDEVCLLDELPRSPLQKILYPALTRQVASVLGAV